MTKDRTVATLNSLLMRVGTFPEHPSYPGPLDIHVPEKLKNRGKAIEGANKLRKKMRWFWTPWSIALSLFGFWITVHQFSDFDSFEGAILAWSFMLIFPIGINAFAWIDRTKKDRGEDKITHQFTHTLYQRTEEHAYSCRVVSRRLKLLINTDHAFEISDESVALLTSAVEILEKNASSLTRQVEIYESLCDIPANEDEQFSNLIGSKLPIQNPDISLMNRGFNLDMEIMVREAETPGLIELLKQRKELPV